MVNFFGIDSNFSNTLFGGANSSNKSNSGSDVFFSTEYASIRNGSYSKLLKNYYAKNGADKGDSEASKTLATTKSDSEELKDSAAEMLKTGKDSVFTKKEVKTKDATTGAESVTYEYDKEAIYKKVKDFTDDYNALMDSMNDVESTSILSKGLTLAKYAKANKNLLKDIGISVGSNNKLTIDEKKFKEVDMGRVKDVFQGQFSFASRAKEKAEQINNLAVSQIVKEAKESYGSNGKYSYENNMGKIYNSFF